MCVRHVVYAPVDDKECEHEEPTSSENKKKEKGKRLAVQAAQPQEGCASRVSTAIRRSAEPPSGLGRPWSTPAKWAKCLSLSEALRDASPDHQQV